MNNVETHSWAVLESCAGLNARIDDAGCPPISDGDLRRLFPGSSLTGQRLDRLRSWLRVLITHNDRLVAVATCRETDGEMRVPDIALDRTEEDLGVHQILHALLDALELAATAGNCRSIVMSTPPVSPAWLQRRGYRAVRESCAGAWLEKKIA
jgi:hypothetical protein